MATPSQEKEANIEAIKSTVVPTKDPAAGAEYLRNQNANSQTNLDNSPTPSETPGSDPNRVNERNQGR